MQTTSRLTILLLALLLLAGAVNAQTTLTPTTSTWTEPLNLSQSGATSQPRFVLVPDGSGHLLWRDQFQGFVYSFHENLNDASTAWSEPLAVELPFGTRRFFPELQPTAATPRFNPHLIADDNGRIHALWIDSEDRLFHSSVDAADFADFNSWSNRQQIAEAARALAVDLAPDGRLHLAYVRPLASADFPAGVYHRYLDSGSTSWSAALLLYESPYLRGVAADDAHVDLTTATQGDSAYVYVGWDNRQRDQIFITRSADGGLQWEAATQIDSRRPDDGPQAAGPAQIRLQAQAAEVLLTWQAGHNGRTCDQYYRWSADAGATWSEPQPMSDQFDSCPDGLHLTLDDQGLMFLLARAENQGTVLLAWDGSRWSDPQRQQPLESFTNPQTFQLVDFGCYQPAVSGDYFWVVGCDRGRSQDIWLIGRPIGSLDSWFPLPVALEEAVWEAPAILAEPATMPAGLSLIGDANGRFHLFWPDTAQSAIAYARHEGGQWSRPSPVLRNPDGGQPGRPAVAQHNGRLLVTWHDDSSGQVLFSWASSDRATAASEWISPRQLPAPQVPIPLVSAPAITVDRQGTIYVAYAVPLNEGRGIYLTWSDDNGQSWSPPFNVFDATAAGWVAVGPPHLMIDGSGRLYASWTENSRDDQPLGLYFAVSDDGGLTWSEETAVVSGSVQWQQMISVGERTIHQLWAGPGDVTTTAAGQAALWHRLSTDGGQSWSRAARVAGLGQNPVGAVGLTLDAAARLHLVQIGSASGSEEIEAAPLSLYQWVWQDERWQAEPALPLGEGIPLTFAEPAAAAVTDRQLGFVYLASPSGEAGQALAFSRRQIELPDVLPTPLPTLMPTATPTPPPTATPQPEPTPTLDFPTEQQPGSTISLPLPDDRLSSLVTGLLPALLLIVIAFIIGVYTMRRR
jgi:hypothetical protein